VQAVVSPQDFAAYSEATGTPYPATSEQKARLYSSVKDWKQQQEQGRRQVAQEQPQRNALADLALGGLVLGGLGGAGYGAYRAWNHSRKPSTAPPATQAPTAPQPQQPAAADFRPQAAPEPPPRPPEGPGAVEIRPQTAPAAPVSPEIRPQPVPGGAQLPMNSAPEVQSAPIAPAARRVRPEDARREALGLQWQGKQPASGQLGLFTREGTDAAAFQGLNTPGKNGNPLADPTVGRLLQRATADVYLDEALLAAKKTGNQALIANTAALVRDWKGNSGAQRVQGANTQDLPDPGTRPAGTLVTLQGSEEMPGETYIVAGGRAPASRRWVPVSPQAALEKAAAQGALQEGVSIAGADRENLALGGDARVTSERAGGAYYQGTESAETVGGKSSLGVPWRKRGGSESQLVSGVSYGGSAQLLDDARDYWDEKGAQTTDEFGRPLDIREMEQGPGLDLESKRVKSVQIPVTSKVDQLASRLGLRLPSEIKQLPRDTKDLHVIKANVSEKLVSALYGMGISQDPSVDKEKVLAGAVIGVADALGLNRTGALDRAFKRDWSGVEQSPVDYSDSLTPNAFVVKDVILSRPGVDQLPGIQAEGNSNPVIVAARSLKGLTDASPNIRKDPAHFERALADVTAQFAVPSGNQQEVASRKQDVLQAYATLLKGGEPPATREELLPNQPAKGGYSAHKGGTDDQMMNAWPGQVMEGLSNVRRVHPSDFPGLLASGDPEKIAAATEDFMRYNPGIAEVVQSDLADADWLTRTNMVAEAIAGATNDFHHAIDFGLNSADPIVRTAAERLKAVGEPGTAQFEHFAKPYIRRYLSAGKLLERKVGSEGEPVPLSISADATKVLLAQAAQKGSIDKPRVMLALSEAIGNESSLANAVWNLQGLTADLGAGLSHSAHGGFGEEPRSYGQILANAFTSAAESGLVAPGNEVSGSSVASEPPTAIGRLKQRLDRRTISPSPLTGGAATVPIRLRFGTDAKEPATLSLNADAAIAQQVKDSIEAPYQTLYDRGLDRPQSIVEGTWITRKDGSVGHSTSSGEKASLSKIVNNRINELNNRRQRLPQAVKAGYVPSMEEGAAAIDAEVAHWQQLGENINANPGELNRQAVLLNRDFDLAQGGESKGRGGFILDFDPRTGRVTPTAAEQFQRATELDALPQGGDDDTSMTPLDRISERSIGEVANEGVSSLEEIPYADTTHNAARGALTYANASQPITPQQRSEALSRIRQNLPQVQAEKGRVHAYYNRRMQGANQRERGGASPGNQSVPLLEKRAALMDEIMGGFRGAAALQHRTAYLRKANQGEEVGTFRPPSDAFLDLAARKLEREESQLLASRVGMRPRIGAI
jgi:hypothetical protein